MAAFTELNVWKMSMTLVESVYALTAAFPREELYGLTSQMRRASASSPSDIVGGYGLIHPVAIDPDDSRA